MTDPAAELREAVRTLRRPGVSGAYTATSSAAAILRAREPLARWLEFLRSDGERRSRTLGDSLEQCISPDALAVARAINGGERS
ncbi:hypothetical protein [Streptomyces sp. NPDC059759]|uniref:hypothetical protein n=1 Tax=Streptomyces sp. NPDC059759 TaxID=3346936 RepID=UPI003660DD7B